MAERKWWENWYNPYNQYSPYEYVSPLVSGMSPGNLRAHMLETTRLKQAGLPVYGEGGYHYKTAADFGKRSIYPTSILGLLGLGQQLQQEVGRSGIEGIPTALQDARWNYRGLLAESLGLDKKDKKKKKKVKNRKRK